MKKFAWEFLNFTCEKFQSRKWVGKYFIPLLGGEEFYNFGGFSTVHSHHAGADAFHRIILQSNFARL